MREYRGKRFDNGEWVYGWYIHALILGDSHHYIRTDDQTTHKVDPDTVGQYTGLRDDQDEQVFEGDKVMKILTGETYTVMWDAIGAVFFFSDGKEGVDYYDFEDSCSSFGFRVVSNIHDHPHLLKGD